MNINNINTPEELLEYMNNNINYGYLGNDNKVHLPIDSDFDTAWRDSYILENYNDILKTNVGNCWDQTEFEREWFEKHGYYVKTFYEQVLLDYNNSYPTHSFLVYTDNNKWYWFENSDVSNAGIHEFSSLDKLLDYQLSTYEFLLKSSYDISDDELCFVKLFEFDKPKEHINCDEYINGIIKQEEYRRK